jgi:hypothetical protein
MLKDFSMAFKNWYSCGIFIHRHRLDAENGKRHFALRRDHYVSGETFNITLFKAFTGAVDHRISRYKHYNAKGDKASDYQTLRFVLPHILRKLFV